MTAPATPQVLQLLLSRGVPRPLSAQTKGSCAILSDDRCITVYDSDAADWTLTAQARWPDELQFDAHPWAAIAPAATGGVVLLNMMSCDLSGLPAEVRKSLLMQQQRYAADPLPASTLAPRYRVTLGSMQLHVSAPSGARRTVPVGGAAFTVSDDAYRRHEQLTFAYLPPSLRVVARALAEFGPLSTEDLLHRLYPAPTPANKSALAMRLSRLRSNPRIDLDRLPDQRLIIGHSEPEGRVS